MTIDKMINSHKTFQTIVGATDTIFFESVTADSVVMTMVFSNKKIFSATRTMFPVAKTMVCGCDTTVFVSHPAGMS